MNSISEIVEEVGTLEQKIVEIEENNIMQVYNTECFLFYFLCVCWYWCFIHCCSFGLVVIVEFGD